MLQGGQTGVSTVDNAPGNDVWAEFFDEGKLLGILPGVQIS